MFLLSLPQLCDACSCCRQCLVSCSNTLELPDYAEALMATQPDLKQEWEAAAAAAEQPTTLQHLADTACPKLLQACCQVLEDRLKVRQPTL